MPSYAGRVDLTQDVGACEVLAWLNSRHGAFLLVLETVDGENPHVHYILDIDANIRVVRQSFTRAFPTLTGNKAYSLTQVMDLAKYHRYICKGESAGEGPHVVGSHGVLYTDDWIGERHAEYWEENASLAAKRQRKAVSVVDAAVERCKAEHILWHQDHEIAKVLIQLTAERGKGINLFAIRSQVNLLMMQLCPDDSCLDRLARAVTARE